MILTITLNPSIDKRYSIEDFEKDRIFRVEDYEYTVGGKGLNVTKVINSFDEKVKATGLLGGSGGKFIENGLNEMNIEHDFIPINGETRSCLAILSKDGSQTEILEKGPSISIDELNNFNNLYDKLLNEADVICASGSLPSGLPKDIYRDMIVLGKKKGKKFILDTSGEALKYGIEAGPYLVKPNKEELEALSGLSIHDESDIIKASEYLLNKGIKVIVVSLGKDGAMVFKEDKIYKIRIPKVKTVNPVGSGDSMIAGFALGFSRGYDFEKMLKLGAACGTANAMESQTGKVDMENVERLMKEIEVEKYR